MRIKNCTVILPLLAALYSSADIYRCQMEDGKWLFTDGPCNNGIGQIVELSPMVTFKKVEPAKLSEAEYQQISNLDRRLAESRELRIRQRNQISNQVRMNNQIKQKNCDLAKRKLARIQDKKRNGYKLSEADALDRQVRNLELIERGNCK